MHGTLLALLIGATGADAPKPHTGNPPPEAAGLRQVDVTVFVFEGTNLDGNAITASIPGYTDSTVTQHGVSSGVVKFVADPQHFEGQMQSELLPGGEITIDPQLQLTIDIPGLGLRDTIDAWQQCMEVIDEPGFFVYTIPEDCEASSYRGLGGSWFPNLAGTWILDGVWDSTFWYGHTFDNAQTLSFNESVRYEVQYPVYANDQDDDGIVGFDDLLLALYANNFDLVLNILANWSAP